MNCDLDILLFIGHTLLLFFIQTPLMKAEFERLAQKKPMDVLSMKRYELPPPSTGRMNDLQAWMECVDNSMAQLEHQTTRYINQSECLMTCSISIIYPFLVAEF